MRQLVINLEEYEVHKFLPAISIKYHCPFPIKYTRDMLVKTNLFEGDSVELILEIDSDQIEYEDVKIWMVNLGLLGWTNMQIREKESSPTSSILTPLKKVFLPKQKPQKN